MLRHTSSISLPTRDREVCGIGLFWKRIHETLGSRYREGQNIMRLPPGLEPSALIDHRGRVEAVVGFSGVLGVFPVLGKDV